MSEEIKLCKDCRFYRQGACTYERNKVVNYVTGEAEYYCEPLSLRQDRYECGPNAKWWQGYEETPPVVTKPKQATVTLPFVDWVKLQEDSDILEALHAAGVDTWEGYEDALDGFES